MNGERGKEAARWRIRAQRNMLWITTIALLIRGQSLLRELTLTGTV